MTLKEFKIQYALGTLDKKTLVEMADDPNTFVEILKILSKDKDEGVRQSVASNHNCPIEILESLSKDKDFFVRHRVMCNAECPIDTQKSLKRRFEGDTSNRFK